jgi:hypothetical protein
MTERTGHCLCGATSYRFDPDGIRFQDICHCASCRRAAGAPFVGWVGVADSHWQWTGAQPATFASSPGVTRTFCRTCGTPLTYATRDLPDETHFSAATLSDPADFHPTRQVFADEALPWSRIDPALPSDTGSADD